MTPSNEDLLALAERADSWNRCWPGNLNLEKLVADLSAALRAIVAERQKPHTYVGGEASVAVCPICDIAGCYHIRAAALDASETPESERQTDLLSESERQAIRDRALEDADYVGELVLKARAAATKASIKFPQPNYVALKIAEEAGEVVRGAVHYAEGRMEWEEVEGEIVQLLAMLIRFVTEGDEINGVIPPAAIRAMKGTTE